MRFATVLLCMLLGSALPAAAQVSIGIGLPGVSIGFNVPSYPQLVQVPGYPVYYAPRLDSNYFFYDGMYWVYQNDNWYASSWYNGPWGRVAPDVVPLYVLRVPVRYYRRPPVYFQGWRPEAPPRWGEHWGPAWEQHRSGWNTWNRSAAPAPAPLPSYQRQYSGDRYPRADAQSSLQSQNYRYQPRDAVTREHYQQQGMQRPPAPNQQQGGQRPPPQSQQPAGQRPPPQSQQPGGQRPPAPNQQAVPAGPPARGPGQSESHRSNGPPPQQGGAPGQRQPPQAASPPGSAMPAAQPQGGNPQGKGPPHQGDSPKGEERGQDRGK